eukprot:c8202_g1_i1.p1 GENE.c8202_g1_i1~~c8202_g1_i1.p1  ORF type:complete len:213 (+),score=67.56 c8202_g1_i1:51-689(+)
MFIIFQCLWVLLLLTVSLQIETVTSIDDKQVTNPKAEDSAALVVESEGNSQPTNNNNNNANVKIKQEGNDVSRFEQYALGDGLGVFLERSHLVTHNKPKAKLQKVSKQHKQQQAIQKKVHSNKLTPMKSTLKSEKKDDNSQPSGVDIRFVNALSQATQPLRVENEMLQNFRKIKETKKEIMDLERKIEKDSKKFTRHHSHPVHINKKTGSLF